jgi:hypothetical protein
VRSGVDHLSEVELIRFLDGEMSSSERELASLHLEGCGECRAGLAETLAIGEELKASDRAGSRAVADGERARVLLRAKLAEARGAEAGSLGDRVRGFVRTRLSLRYVYGAVAFAGVLAVISGLPGLHRSVADIAVSLPNRALTPGMTHSVSLQDICAAEDEDLDPAVPYSRQEAVFREYGISIDRSAKDFQVDYLISPQLGGTDDVRNLWPQSYGETRWNARAKDALERHLSRMVCEKKIDLAEAQREIATNWIAAYQKYLGTSRPG